MEDREIVTEFLIESTENLSRLDQELVELEKRPKDGNLLASIFRTIHTIKGTCGFLGFSNLEATTHHAENLLSRLRNGELELSPARVSLILETVDATRQELISIEKTGAESGEAYMDLRQRLQVASAEAQVEAAAPAGAVPQPASETAKTEEAVNQRGPAAADSTIRVDVALLSRLMNLVGELVLARNQILQFSALQENAQLNATSQRLNLITTQLQEGVMKTRMQPIGVVWNKLPRVVRDLAASCGKQIRLEMDGADTELDKSIIEAIKDPLTHIVRNCCDHGIEQPPVRVGRSKPAEGRLQLRAFHEGGQVNIEIVDDGGGIDPARVKAKALQKGLIRPEQAEAMSDREAVQLVFHPGFSTAEQVTNISGRGVGMDVVRTNIEKIGGSVDLASLPGEGTTVKLKIPLTLAIIPGLVVRSGGQRFVIPQANLVELVRLEGVNRNLVERVQGAPVFRRRGSLLPLASLNELLQLTAVDNGPSEVINIVILQAEDRKFGLIVDMVADTQEIVVKPLGKQLKGLTSYAGATIMGDGRVALILDVVGLGQRAGVVSAHNAARQDAAAASKEDPERQSLLVFRAGGPEPLAVPLGSVARLEEFPPSRIEQANGRGVVQYRGQILPLIALGPMLNSGSSNLLESGAPVPVVVFGDGENAVGVVVDQIIDIVESEVVVRRESPQGLVFGSAVVSGKVTGFVDVPMVVALSGEKASARPEQAKSMLSVLVAAGSGISRGMARAYLEMAGHKVREAATVEQALQLAKGRPFEAVIVGHDLPGSGSQLGAVELLERLRATSACKEVPVIAFAGDQSAMGEAGFNAWYQGLDRDSITASLEQLAGSLHLNQETERDTLIAR